MLHQHSYGDTLLQYVPLFWTCKRILFCLF